MRITIRQVGENWKIVQSYYIYSINRQASHEPQDFNIV